MYGESGALPRSRAVCQPFRRAVSSLHASVSWNARSAAGRFALDR